MWEMEPDALIDYGKERIKIKVDTVVNLGGKQEHVIISYTGSYTDVVEGVALLFTPDELKHADDYETEDYKRVEVTLRSGKPSWVYVKNDNR